MNELAQDQATNHYYFVEAILGNLHHIKGNIDVEQILGIPELEFVDSLFEYSSLMSETLNTKLDEGFSFNLLDITNTSARWFWKHTFEAQMVPQRPSLEDYGLLLDQLIETLIDNHVETSEGHTIQ